MNASNHICNQLKDLLLKEDALHDSISNLLKDQRQAILGRQQRRLMELTAFLNARVAEAVILKKQREVLIYSLQEAFHLPRASSLTDIIPFIPAQLGDPLKVLVVELLPKFKKSEEIVEQNKQFLNRLLRITRDLIQKIAPGHLLRTYDKKGAVSITSSGKKLNLDLLA